MLAPARREPKTAERWSTLNQWPSRAHRQTRLERDLAQTGVRFEWTPKARPRRELAIGRAPPDRMRTMLEHSKKTQPLASGLARPAQPDRSRRRGLPSVSGQAPISGISCVSQAWPGVNERATSRPASLWVSLSGPEARSRLLEAIEPVNTPDWQTRINPARPMGTPAKLPVNLVFVAYSSTIHSSSRSVQALAGARRTVVEGLFL